jgi:hypothetical protein
LPSSGPAEALDDLGLQRGLQQQLRAEPGDLPHDLRQLSVRSGQLADVAADALTGRYSSRHGRGAFLRDLTVLKGGYARLVMCTGSWTLPSAAKRASVGKTWCPVI